jgi:hypothetical protein
VGIFEAVEGLKKDRQPLAILDGVRRGSLRKELTVGIFRIDAHLARFSNPKAILGDRPAI